MKKNIFKIAAAVLVLAVVTVCIIACNKEKIVKTEPQSLSNLNTKSATDCIVLATAKKGDIEATLTFNKAEFEQLFQEELAKLDNNNFIFDDISIWDENISDPNNVVSLRVSLINSLDENSVSIFFVIDKLIDGDNISYVTTKGLFGKKKIECRSRNCRKGCRPNFWHTDCVPCEEPQDGVCVKTITWESNDNDGAKIIIDILIALITIIH